MSYILDALKKADRERAIGELPDLESAHWVERRSGRSYRWVWVIIALLLVNGVLLAVLVGRDSPEEVAAVASRTDAATTLPVTPQPRTSDRVVEKPRVPVRPRIEVPAAPPVATRSRPPVAQMPPATVPAPVPPPAQGDAAAVPAWDELPLEFRSRFALPRLDVHVYADEPRRRFILTDLQKYREGDTLENGAVLEEILPNSIQLYYEGTRFRMEK